jgi:hypothetical protein
MYNMYLGREKQDYGRYVDEFNAWQAERDYLAKRYEAERANDYSRWEYDNNLAYDEYNAGREMAWKEYKANMEKDQAAAKLTAAAGNYDRLAQLYGLSADEVKAIQNANAPKPTPAPTGDDVGDAYTSLTWEDWDRAEKKLSGVDSFKKLEEVVDGFYELGYSEETVKALTAAKVRELTELMAPTVEPNRSNRLYGSGRVGG